MRILLPAVAALLAGCTRSSQPAAGPPVPLSATDRVSAFEEAWSAVNSRYYDPQFNGVDWQAVHAQYRPVIDTVTTTRTFYAVLNRMVGTLRDAHTRVLTPQAATNQANQQASTIGVVMDAIDRQYVVSRVVPGTSTAAAGIEPGMIVLTVNGTAVDERVRQATARQSATSTERFARWRTWNAALAPALDGSLTVEMERPDASHFTAKLSATTISSAPVVTSRLLPSGVAYVSLSVFRPPAQDSVTAAVRRYAGARGVVFDLRGNPGGASKVLDAIAALFFDDRVVFAKSSVRHGDRMDAPVPVYEGRKGGVVYRGPVAILLDQRSGSSSELLASGMQETMRALVVGDTTCGCVLGIQHPIRFQDGGELDIAEVEFFTLGGIKLEGRGVIPNIVVRSGLDDLRARRDAALEAAERALLAASQK